MAENRPFFFSSERPERVEASANKLLLLTGHAKLVSSWFSA
jgi:hypothetical protein